MSDNNMHFNILVKVILVMIYHSNRLISLSLFIKHFFKKEQLTQSHNYNCQQFYNCKILHFTLVTCDNLGVNYLTLFFKQLIFCNFFKTLSDIDQLSVKLIYFTLLSKFQKMGLIMSVEID